MENYIVCEERANHSRIHVQICRHRCKNAETCQAFQDYIKTHPAETVVQGPDAVSLPQENLVPPRAA
ncbi:MAG: hypothetical protein JRJ42_03370 [Deltaproteobacteria bacterium]|nr:hypothetical protein [Deltaproteobacteria bacterium]MBW2019263.1 hypothetical protein [Deltaproteobacteria bacterium]MBW2074069.1 hypothetical protein [Deltaproteobacteria bacterium]